MASNIPIPPVEPRKVVPDQDCKACHGSGEFADWVPMPFGSGNTPMYTVCDCVLDQLAYDDEPFTIDTTPNDLTRGINVKEG